MVRRKGSGLEETRLCVLSPRCVERHFPADCLLFRELPTHHRVSLLAAAGICKKCLSHSRRDGGRAEQCEGQHVEDHWLCRFFSDPEGPEIERKLLPVVISQPDRLTYKCRTVIHVKSRSDLQTGRYSVQLTTLYDSDQRHSFIMNEVALAHALRYIQVPEKRVDISPATWVRTTKLFILDVKPRSKMATAGARLVTAYGIDEMGMMLQKELSLNGVRSKFATRPGRRSNTNVAQPKAVAQLVIGRDNQAHMPVAALRSVKDGTDLYVMRNDLFVGEMLFGETDKSGQKKKGAAGGPKTTSTPKPKQLKARDPPTASKWPEKAAPVQNPPTASKRPEAAEERPAAGPPGIKSRRRQDSSPALSVAASDSMMSSAGGAVSDTPVKDGGRKKSSSREPPLIYAKKSKAGGESRTSGVPAASPGKVAQDSSASGTCAASPGKVAQDSSASRTHAVSLEILARDSSASTSSAASSRGVSRGSSACSSRAASSRSGAQGSSSSGTDNSSSDEDDSDSGCRRLNKAEALVATRLADLITAQKKMKEADQQIKEQIREQMEKEKRREELRKIAARKAEKEGADKVAAKAEAAEKAEADRKKLEADRQRDRQGEGQKEEKRRREQAEARKRPEEDRVEARKRPEEDRVEARKRPEG